MGVGTYANGKPIDQGGPEGSDFAWDGMEHTVHEASPKVDISCTPVKNGALEATIRINGNLVTRTHEQVSADGQTLTQTIDNTDEQGRDSKGVLVFEKQEVCHQA